MAVNGYRLNIVKERKKTLPCYLEDLLTISALNTIRCEFHVVIYRNNIVINFRINIIHKYNIQ